jgi:hypothetical protein
MTITELRILPPLAIARLGASENPLGNYELEVPEHDSLGFRRITSAETLEVDRTSGEITRSYTAERIRFRDGEQIRPVAPFLEVYARTSAEVLEPLTLDLLASHHATPDDITWRVEVGNLKIFRRTEKPDDRIEAVVTFSDHRPHALEGRCNNFFRDKCLPLGSVQFIKPTTAFPEIRLRFTPAKGFVYGAETDDNIPADRVIYDSSEGSGTWRGYADPNPPGPLQTVPSNIYASYTDKNGNEVSRGYLDDECDGIVSVELKIAGRKLCAFSRIGAGPPTFAPDSIPIRTVADELEQVLFGYCQDPRKVELEQAEEILRRAVESVRLMNTAVLNGNTVEGRANAQSTMVRQDTNDFGRYYQPIMTPTSVDNHAVLALHQNVLAALRSGTGAWFAEVLRRPHDIGDLTDFGRRKMPAMMRGADGRYLTLSLRQIDTIVKVAAGDIKPTCGDAARLAIHERTGGKSKP